MLICSPIQFHPKMFPILLKLGVELFGLEADHWLIGPRLHSWHSSVLTALVGRSPPTPFIRWWTVCTPDDGWADWSDPSRMARAQVEWLKMNGRNALTRLTWSTSWERPFYSFCHHNWSPYDLTTGQYFLPLLSTHQKYPVLTLWWIE